MKFLGNQSLKVDDIDVSDRLRAIDEGHASLLAENIRETGRLRHPIEVRKHKARKGKKPFGLMAGGHRWWAVARILGWEEIECAVFEADDDEARLAEIDENLVRHDLNPLDRAVFLAERKAIYERLHPDTVAGVAGGKARQGTATEIISFARDTAERCGITDRTVRTAVMIANSLPPEIRTRLAGTKLAKNQSELVALTRIPAMQRLAAIDLVLDETSKINSVKAAARELDGAADPVSDDRQKKIDALNGAWNRAKRPGRKAWLAQLRPAELAELRELLAEIDAGTAKAA